MADIFVQIKNANVSYQRRSVMLEPTSKKIYNGSLVTSVASNKGATFKAAETAAGDAALGKCYFVLDEAGDDTYDVSENGAMTILPDAGVLVYTNNCHEDLLAEAAIGKNVYASTVAKADHLADPAADVDGALITEPTNVANIKVHAVGVIEAYDDNGIYVMTK